VTTVVPGGAGPRIAVMIPCYNEEIAIPRVVADFRHALPRAAIYVYDNNSSDRTAAVARAAGAIVRREGLQGKGNVVRRMFADIEADIYVLVDGDDTYAASDAPEMVRMLLDEQLDMVTGLRVSHSITAYRRGHRFGNWMLTGMVRAVFGQGISDMLSGYRVFSRRFVKSFPAVASGFETETEFSVHALEMRMAIDELRTPYKDRPAGTASKLRTYSDGLRVLRAIVQLVKQERPLQFFSISGLFLALLGFGLGVPVILTFLETGLVPRLPTALLATGLMLLSFLSFSVGLILESVAQGRKELKRLSYLGIPAVAPIGLSAGQPGGDGFDRVQRQDQLVPVAALVAAESAAGPIAAQAIRGPSESGRTAAAFAGRAAGEAAHETGVVPGSEPPPAPRVDAKYYEVATPRSLSERLVVRARDRIYADFLRLCVPAAQDSVLDVGVSDVVGDAANVLERRYPWRRRITAVGLGSGEDFIAAYPEVAYRRIEPNRPLPFADDEIDIVTSNAVLEHVGSAENQRRFVAELMRVGRRGFLTVPNRFFPVEHHTGIPLLHWMDRSFAVACRVLGKQTWSRPETLILMSRSRLRAACPPGAAVRIGTTGLLLGPFSANLYLYWDRRRGV
jgi:hypothetical protein